jgi:hypothetical protein
VRHVSPLILLLHYEAACHLADLTETPGTYEWAAEVARRLR